jgi:hypothetical protein
LERVVEQDVEDLPRRLWRHVGRDTPGGTTVSGRPPAAKRAAHVTAACFVASRAMSVVGALLRSPAARRSSCSIVTMSRSACASAAADLDPVDARQADVEHEEVDAVLAEPLQRGLARADVRDRVSLPLERAHQRLRDRGVILDNEQSCDPG